MNGNPQPTRGGDKPPTNMPFLIAPAPPKKLPPPPAPVSPAMWAVMVLLFVASFVVLMRVVSELRNRPLPAQSLYLITPMLLSSPTSAATRQSTPTLAPTATPSPSVTSTSTATTSPTSTPTPTPVPASPSATFAPVPATALALEVVSENPLAKWNNNFQLPVLPTPPPPPPASLPTLDTNWQAYVVAGLVGVNWFLAAVAFLMWRSAGKPTITPPPMVVNMPALPAPSPSMRVVGRNDERLPIQQIVAIAAPPPPHSPLVTAPLPASPPVTGDITGDITGITADITSDGDGDITGDAVTSPVTHTLHLPISPPRPLIGEEVAYCRQLHKNGMSKNQLCINFFGAKNPRRMALIQEALDE